MIRCSSRLAVGLLLFVIIAVSFLIRNPFLDQPFTGHFGSYQSIVGMIAYEYAKHNFANFFMPNSLLIVNGAPALEMIYYPLDAFAAAVLWKLLGGSLDYWGRLQSMLFSALAGFLLYLGVKKMSGKKVALWSVFFFSFSPMSLIYGRMFMNEAAALSFLTASFICLGRWRETFRVRYLVNSGLLFSVSIILRLHFAAGFPAFLYLIWQTRSRNKAYELLFFSVPAITLAALWFWHTYAVTMANANTHTSLFAQLGRRGFPDPVLGQGDFYIRVFIKELVFRLWGPLTSVLVFSAFFLKRLQPKGWIIVYFLSLVAVIFLMPGKFYDHSFYLMALLFPGALLAGWTMTSLSEKWSPLRVAALTVMILASQIIFFWRPAFMRASDDDELFQAVAYIQEATDSRDRIVALHGTSLDFLYYLRRYGTSFAIGPARSVASRSQMSNQSWGSEREGFQGIMTTISSSSHALEYLREHAGVTYFAVVSKEELNLEPEFRDYLERNYQLVSPPARSFGLYRLN